MGLGAASALYHLFDDKNSELAELFMRKFCTGENLSKTDVEYKLRGLFLSDQQRRQNMQTYIKCMIVIKAWNLRRRKNRKEIKPSQLRILPNEAAPIII